MISDSSEVKSKILAVDDTPANLEVISETLSDAGYNVVAAIDGERAIKRLQNYHPDLILLDIQMPGMDGFETCRRIRSNPKTAGIPIIFITANTDTESKVKGFAMGGIDYITKPFEEKEMLARVKTHLRLHQLSQSLEQKVSERTLELKVALTQVKEFQLQLIQHEKMSALGNLIAGVGHEINNPLGAILGNMDAAKLAIADLIELLQMYRDRRPDEDIQEQEAEIDIDYLIEDIPKMLNSMFVSCDRIRQISKALRIFSRYDTENKVKFDLHQGIESTLLILKYRLKANETRPAIQIMMEAGKIPEIDCHPGQINQVFMNILTNAIDALDESNINKNFQEIEKNPNQIKITTELSHDRKNIIVKIADNGTGMPEAVKCCIFEQGFTTKAVSKGTGLGLAIAHSIITEKHEGAIACHSEVGKGTEFIISLPL